MEANANLGTPFQRPAQCRRVSGLVQLRLCRARHKRRSFVTNARRYGVPESVVMRMSGHKTRAVFERYNVVAEEDLRDAVQRIEGARLRQKTVKVSKEEPEDSKALSVSTERA